MIKTQHPTQPGFIGAVDNARRTRLLDLCDLTRSSKRQIINLEWPDYYEQERTALNDLALDGPKTIIPLARQLSGYSQKKGQNGIVVILELIALALIGNIE